MSIDWNFRHPASRGIWWFSFQQDYCGGFQVRILTPLFGFGFSVRWLAFDPISGNPLCALGNDIWFGWKALPCDEGGRIYGRSASFPYFLDYGGMGL